MYNKVECYHFNYYLKFNQNLNQTKKFFLNKIINLIKKQNKN